MNKITIAFALPSLGNMESRRAILPDQLKTIEHNSQILIEKGYGDSLGITDEDYLKAGASIATRPEIEDAPIICDIKAEHRTNVQPNQILVGWSHVDEPSQASLRDLCITKNATVIEWANMHRKEGQDLKHIFSESNKMAGIASVRHAFNIFETIKYAQHSPPLKIAVLGYGNVGKGAVQELQSYRLDPDIYRRNNIDDFDISKYDVTIDAMLWTPKSNEKLPSENRLLKSMKNESVLINVGWGVFRDLPNMSLTSPSKTLDNGALYYGATNSPSYTPIPVSKSLSAAFAPYIEKLLSGPENWGETIENALMIKSGEVVNESVKQTMDLEALTIK